MNRGVVTVARWLALGSVVASLLLVLLGVGQAGAVIDDPDIDTSAEYRYRVDPELGQVDVTIELTVTADKPNQTTSTGYYQYFFDGTFLAIPAEVGDLQVTDGAGRALDYEIDDSVADVLQLQIDFRRNLFYRQTTEVIIAFTLPGGAARGDEQTRVNGAYAGFQAWVDPRLEAASLAVITPPGFVDRSIGSETFGASERREGPDGPEHWFVLEDVDPEFQWASVSLARDESLVTTEFDVEVDDDVEDRGRVGFDVLAWPGDEEWTEFVTENLDDGLPVLAEEIGLPWPLSRDLTVIESYDPYLNGYAGWYDVRSAEIEIGDELDSHVMFHELSHVWFNGNLFEERWITEGLADEFGAEVVETLGEDRPTPPRTSSSNAAAVPLNQWSDWTDDVDEETWAYGASWTVTTAMADIVGLDVLSGAAQAAAADHIAYVGDGEPETETRAKDWHLYLDLIENKGEVTDDQIVDLFEEWVVTSREAEVLTDRASSRERYAALEDAGDSWAPPLAVRRAMARWRFGDADRLIAEADDVLDRRADTVEVLDDLAPLLPAGTAVTLPDVLEETFESADDDLDEAADLAEEALAAAEELRASGEAIDGATGPLQWIGAIGAEHRDELAVAATRFSGGDLAGAVAGADRIDADVEELSRRGLIRLVIAVVVVVVIAGLVAWLVRRRRRRAVAAAGIAEAAGIEAPPELPAGDAEGSDGSDDGDDPGRPDAASVDAADHAADDAGASGDGSSVSAS